MLYTYIGAGTCQHPSLSRERGTHQTASASLTPLPASLSLSLSLAKEVRTRLYERLCTCIISGCVQSVYEGACTVYKCTRVYPRRGSRLTPAYVGIRQHTSAYVSIRASSEARHASDASICRHTPAYVSIRQHTCLVRGEARV